MRDSIHERVTTLAEAISRVHAPVHGLHPQELPGEVNDPALTRRAADAGATAGHGRAAALPR